MTIQRAGAIGLAPLILNPATLAALAVGAVGYGLYRLLDDEDEADSKEPAKKPLQIAPPRRRETITPAMRRNEDEPARTISETPAVEAVKVEVETVPEVAEDDKELIRKAMSELGKKSAAARAKKKAALAAEA